MVVPDPAAELLRLVTGAGDPPPSVAAEADRRAAALVRRRFGLALPPPFASIDPGGEPVRVATPADGAAIAAVKWRAFGSSYRGGILPDEFLDRREVVPPAAFWTGRAMVPPSRRHRLLVWGRPGTVFGYLDAGPAHPPGRVDRASPRSDAVSETDDVGEVYELYVDPSVQHRGGGAALLAAAEAWFQSVGYRRAELSTLVPNVGAQAFYRAHGWAATGEVVATDLGVVAFEEARFARSLGPGDP